MDKNGHSGNRDDEFGKPLDYRKQAILDRQFIIPVPTRYLEQMTDLSHFLFPQEIDKGIVPVNIPGWMMVYGTVESVRRWRDFPAHSKIQDT